MDRQPLIKPSTKSEAIAALLSIGIGFGLGYALLYATGSVFLAIVMASATAHLVNAFVRGKLG